ncbi:MAG: P1 family peptidase [Bacteroidota bacterium]
MLTNVSGFRVGHYTDERALTGCTVVLCPPKTVGGCEVRGSSPGSRELALLSSDRTMQEVHAVLLTGGSAFGLAAADGVMRYLEEQGIGYETPWAKVPIVPAAVIFDLNIGDKNVRPGADEGYKACMSATSGKFPEGNAGAGTGATVGKWGGPEFRMKGGLGNASLTDGDLVVGALAVANSVGDVLDEKGDVLAGARMPHGRFLVEENPLRKFALRRILPIANTTLVVVATNAKLSKVETNRVAQRAHNGVARSIVPAHTSYDGDVSFALASGIVDANFDLVAEMGAVATAGAIRMAVRAAKSVEGVLGLAG